MRRGRLRCASSSIPMPRSPAEPRDRPLDARAHRSRERIAYRRPGPRREGEGDRRRNRPAEAGSAPTRRSRSAPCWRARANSWPPSRSSPTRSTSSETRWRPSTTPGCSSCSPVSVDGADAWTRPKRRCTRQRRRWPSSGTRGQPATLADGVAVELEAARARAESGELLEPPTEAELAVLRLLATDLSIRQIAERLFSRPTRSGPTSGRSTASSGPTPIAGGDRARDGARPVRPRAVTRVIVAHPV